MTLVRWNPARNFFGAHNEMDRMVDRFFSPELFGELNFGSNGWIPNMDISEDKDRFAVNLELPGLTKDDVKITFRDGNLIIEGERKENQEKKEVDYHLVERRYGKFRRVFSIKTPVKENKIEALFKDGILTVNIPKAEEVKPKEIKVKVEG